MSRALSVSVAANVALLGVVAALALRAPSPASPASQSDQSAPLALAKPPQRDAEMRAGTPDPSAEDARRTTLQQLERLGFSRDVVGRAVVEDFARRWDRRMHDLQRQQAGRKLSERELIELSRARHAEEIRALKSALGEEGYLAWDQDRTLRLLNTGGVPLNRDEATAAYQLQKEFDDKHRELQLAMEEGVADPADVATLQDQARQTLDRGLEALLGKEHFSALRGRGDPIAEAAWRYSHLNPTPEKAKLVLQAESTLRDREAALVRRIAENSTPADTLVAELEALDRAHENMLRQILGQESFDTRTLQNDPTYKRLVHYASAWDLKPKDIEPLYATLRAFHDRADTAQRIGQLRATAGQRVNWREINAAVEQVRQQTETELQTLIGSERVRRLKQNGVLDTR